MRKILSFVLILSLVFSFACAEVFSDAYYEDLTLLEYVSLGDEGYPIAALFRMIGFTAVHYDVPGDDYEPVFTKSAFEYLVEYQLEHGLEPTGCFDPETALYITADLEPEISTLVWIPMHGGHKYHRDKDCSNMDRPCKIPKSAALALGFTYCKRCWEMRDPEVPN